GGEVADDHYRGGVAGDELGRHGEEVIVELSDVEVGVYITVTEYPGAAVWDFGRDETQARKAETQIIRTEVLGEYL
ncbi:hypothetical protein V490_09105, partial [Pseudogymnoascus sp. VKM F-3557]